MPRLSRRWPRWRGRPRLTSSCWTQCLWVRRSTALPLVGLTASSPKHRRTQPPSLSPAPPQHSLGSVPADQLRALARMAAEELKKREQVAQPAVTPLAAPTVLDETVEPAVQPIVDVKPKAAPVKKAAAAAPIKKAPMTSASMAELIKNSVAKALGNNGVKYDEAAVTEELVQIR